jgi:antitoxin MazE
MRVRIRRWGNSLGLRIPQDIIRRTGLKEGAEADVALDEGRIVIAPPAPRYELKDLLAGMTPDAVRDAFDWGPDRGREMVEEWRLRPKRAASTR